MTAAARALAVGDPLAPLKRVALRDDAAALALRGIATAQVPDLVRREGLLCDGLTETISCLVAEEEADR